jgi:ATP-dependent RNA helicase DeaD
MVTLDEADRMLDIGFRPDIEKILRRCPESRQTLLLSATVPPPVQKIAARYMRDPEIMDFSTNELAVETIEQRYFTVDPTRKFDLLVRLLERENPRQVIVFCRTKRGTDKIHEKLSRRRSLQADEVACIHGDLAQSVRDRVMRQFRDGSARILVATDVVGRGIDVSSVSHIVNYDIPEFCDDYVHRVGRTGRMGREGIAFTFVSPEEGPQLTRIEMRIERLLKRDEIEGFDAFDRRPKPAPIEHLPTGGFQRAADAQAAEAEPAAEAPKRPPAATLGKGRGPKRHRRAL